MKFLSKYLILCIVLVICSLKSHAATFTIANGDVAALRMAILEASKNNDEDIIILASNGLYELTTAHESVIDGTADKGGVGLPTVRGTLIIRGNGATIRRATNAPKFRIFYTATNARITIENLTIQNGLSDTDGAGIYQGFDGRITLTNVKFFNNISGGIHGGAAFFKTNNVAVINNCEFKGNSVRDYGGGVSSLLSDLTVTNTIFEDNKTTATQVFTANYPEGQGGGLQVDGGKGDNGKILIRNCKFISNKAGGGGAGLTIFLYNNNTSEVNQCEFNQNELLGLNNSALGAGVNYGSGTFRNAGAGYTTIPNTCKAIFANSTWFANISARQAAGIFVGRASNKSVDFDNCTFVNNESKNGVGGAMENFNGPVEINNCTFVGNVSTGTGAGIRTNSNDAKANVSNTIFSNNRGSNNLNHFNGPSGTFVDGGNNLHFHSTNTGTGGLPNTIMRADPLLESLADNGGPTKTIALKMSSPAIDAGNNCTPTDQRGQARIGRCDIGAFEFVPANTPSAPIAPSALVATTNSATQITLNWNDNSNNETGFKIERSTTAGGGFAEIGQVGAGITTFASTGLTANTSYFYRVRAFNATGNSGYSNEANATTSPVVPAAPSNLTATTNSTSQITLNWADNSNNENGFKIERSTTMGSGFVEIAQLGTGVTNYVNTGLSAGTTYFYRVASFNSAGNSSYSNEASATTNPATVVPSAPSNLVATANSSTQITLTWRDNSGLETGFKIERSTTAGGGFMEIGQVGASIVTFANTDLSPNTTYFYRVRAFNAIGNSNFSNEASAMTLASTQMQTPPAAPSNLSAMTNSSTQITLNWTDNSSNETGFKIERSNTSVSGFTEIGQVGAGITTFANTGLEPSTTYFYRVRAFSNAGNSGYSNEASTTTQSITPIPTAPTAPTGLNAVANLTTQITLSWTDNANNENGFKIERSTNSAGSFTEIAQVGAGITTFVNTGLNPSTTYFYRVRAFNDVGNSAYSNEANATTLSPPVPNAPINLIATSPTQGRVILNWADNSTDETGFRIERSSGGAFTEIGQVGANVATFTDNNLTFGSMLTYRIRAFNAAGNSNFSNEANITVTAVGLIDISHSLQIYPNPSADKFILQLDYKKQGEFRFRMTDLAGRSIITHSWDKNGEVLFKEIEVNQLPSGVYILELVHEEFRAIKRFLKD